MRWLLLLLSALVLVAPAQALTPAQALALAKGETESRIKALNALVAVPDEKTVALIQALSDDAVKVTDTAVIVIKDGKGFDPVSGAEVAVPDTAEDVINNNQMRTELGAALALVGLQSPDTKIRLEAVKTLASDPSEDKLPLIEKAYAGETVPAIKDALGDLRFALLLGNADRAKRLEAAKSLAESGTPATKLLLSERIKVETDPEVRTALRAAVEQIDGRLAWGERLGVVFTGISLGSILLLVALGLAITYGLMGVINMAHGELMMIGAYATYVVQNLFRSYLPGAFDWYVIAAIPVSFLAAAAVGAVLERGVIRWLYGRPL
ncbi:MAG: urea ABC transporter permease subunit UrtB, partial [Burkholderiaceae bacterium]|nr:urea ABC transporter permease subunit UrtB [Burkholderiaceae bacterium]